MLRISIFGCKDCQVRIQGSLKLRFKALGSCFRVGAVLSERARKGTGFALALPVNPPRPPKLNWSGVCARPSCSKAQKMLLGVPGNSPVVVSHHSLFFSPFLRLGNPVVLLEVRGNRRSLSPFLFSACLPACSLRTGWCSQGSREIASPCLPSLPLGWDPSVPMASTLQLLGVDDDVMYCLAPTTPGKETC